ncbi:MAG: sugar ABC transporter permease [Anaerolineaceae bacterium]|nr:MAG: sugar ABC transporter permease [Anaerolineaceae bacterium]
MDATLDYAPRTADKNWRNQFENLIIPLSILINQVVLVVTLSLSINILDLDERGGLFALIGGITGVDVGNFGNLGAAVQNFTGLLLLTPVLMSIYGSVRLYFRKQDGRYFSLLLHFASFAVCVVVLLQLWGVFLSFESVVDGIMEMPWVLLGIPLAYVLFWIAGKFSPVSQLRAVLEYVALGMAGLTFIGFVIFSDLLSSTTLIRLSQNFGVWLAIAGLLAFGIIGFGLLRMGDAFGETPDQRVAWQGWLMLSPNIIGFTLFFAGPLLLSFYLSFTVSRVGQTPVFTGLDNYRNITALEFAWYDPQAAAQPNKLAFAYGGLQEQFVWVADESVRRYRVNTVGYNVLARWDILDRTLYIGARDRQFWRSMGNTITFCLMLVPLATIPAVGMSILLNSKMPGMKFFRAVYFLPSVAAVVGTATIWRWLYQPQGFYNYFLAEITGFFNSVLGTNYADPQILWLNDPGVVLFSIVLLAAWQVVGFNTVLFLAGLQGIPRPLYEAATVDGAGRWKQFWYITLPMLRPTTFFVLTTTIITGLQVFNEPYTLFPARPIPENAVTSVYYIWITGFTRLELGFGYASAVAWLLFALIFLVTLGQFRVQGSGQYD